MTMKVPIAACYDNLGILTKIRYAEYRVLRDNSLSLKIKEEPINNKITLLKQSSCAILCYNLSNILAITTLGTNNEPIGDKIYQAIIPPASVDTYYYHRLNCYPNGVIYLIDHNGNITSMSSSSLSHISEIRIGNILRTPEENEYVLIHETLPVAFYDKQASLASRALLTQEVMLGLNTSEARHRVTTYFTSAIGSSLPHYFKASIVDTYTLDYITQPTPYLLIPKGVAGAYIGNDEYYDNKSAILKRIFCPDVLETFEIVMSTDLEVLKLPKYVFGNAYLAATKIDNLILPECVASQKQPSFPSMSFAMNIDLLETEQIKLPDCYLVNRLALECLDTPKLKSCSLKAYAPNETEKSSFYTIYLRHAPEFRELVIDNLIAPKREEPYSIGTLRINIASPKYTIQLGAGIKTLMILASANVSKTEVDIYYKSVGTITHNNLTIFQPTKAEYQYINRDASLVVNLHKIK